LLVTLDRVERANAYTAAMLEDLRRGIEQARAEPAIMAAVVTGAGRVFCAGADLDELGDKDERDALALRSRQVFDLWADAPWPTVAAIQGAAVGGGFELALACDLRLCGPAALFRFPELALGLVPAAGGIRRLVAELGPARAKEMILFGEQLDAETALRWGLVARVVDDPLAHAIELAGSMQGLDPMALRLAKMLIHERADTAHARPAEAIAQALLYARRKRSRTP
jgi:enoyl-CoA hydratase/carnithine racemase